MDDINNYVTRVAPLNTYLGVLLNVLSTLLISYTFYLENEKSVTSNSRVQERNI